MTLTTQEALTEAPADQPAGLRAAGQPKVALPKVALSFEAIAARLRTLELPAVDVVYGIATGGVVPAALVAYRLGKPLEVVTINYRREDNTQQRPAPEVLSVGRRPTPGSRVLLVDDVSVTGQTLQVAREALLGDCQVTTLVMKGRGDVVVFPEVGTCVAWPWKSA